MMNRAFSIVLATLLGVSIFLAGMFFSFTAGGIRIAQNCDLFNAFYGNGKLYVCIPKTKEVTLSKDMIHKPKPSKAIMF